jgi:hypothetical protein
MWNRRNVVIISGFIVALLFATWRFSQTPAYRQGLSALRPDLWALAKFISVATAVTYAILAIVGFLQNKLRAGAAETHASVRWVRVVEFAALSVILGPLLEGFPFGGPGGNAAYFTNHLLDRYGNGPSLGLSLFLVFFVDIGVCFAILWSGYLLWTRFQRRGSRRDS